MTMKATCSPRDHDCPILPSRRPQDWTALLAWYVLFGALHELAHWVMAAYLGHATDLDQIYRDSGLIGVVHVVTQIVLLRQIPLPLQNHNHQDYKNAEQHAVIIQHAGWIFSCLVAAKLLSSTNAKFTGLSNKTLAATLTALEALSTDLLGWTGRFNNGTASSHVFFCGNFGILLLHQAWTQSNDHGQTALDVLEKMVQVTMMRGAQSGGVVTFQKRRGIRCRVVNQKRTDLSKLVRAKVQRQVNWKLPVPFVSGHTRFATSSKASLDGTHPQQWSPPSPRKVFDMTPTTVDGVVGGSSPMVTPQTVKVENYITHNGDFDFYQLHGITYDLEVIQTFLATVLHVPLPSTVDSCSVAGLVDLLRTRGSFGLSVRYALSLGLKTSRMNIKSFPAYADLEKLGDVFENVMVEMLKAPTTMHEIGDKVEVRNSFAQRVASKIESNYEVLGKPLVGFLTDDEGDASLFGFCLCTINAFFDNDLFFTTKTFLHNAKGSFGLCIVSSLDADRQICLAARGQTTSVAFYPNKGIVCYGSEQAAVKAAMSVDFPGRKRDELGRSRGDLDDDALRLDLDDLGGEIMAMDWGSKKIGVAPVAKESHEDYEYEMMNGKLTIVLHQESKSGRRDSELYHRMTRLTRNRLVQPLQELPKDPVQTDIHDIPKICSMIQEEWHVEKAASSLNRLTAFNFSRCLRGRLEAHIAGTVHPRSVDILLTGCEVSLWLAEQFASDLQKAFPNLRIKAVSSNKLLGLYGQEIAVPCVGFADSPDTHRLDDAIVIIVSHSGGTFGPLSCSNLLQSTTRSIFVVTSEWDTQIGKQLRAMDAEDDDEEHIFKSRIFSTEVGMRPAEPCSVSVVATHQLLTNLLEYISVVILSDPRYRRVTAAVISEQDIAVLERLNRENISALCEIVGATSYGDPFTGETSKTESHLRAVGALWADHVLENARAYIMTFIYIFATVVSGYAPVYSIARAAGLGSTSGWAYFVRLFDSALYFWMPQINITILRILQGRNLRHRMVGRTVVIGDIPWVAQASDAFLSKMFACSYSIAGLHVLSGNPADHFVHRHTHRVVRGALVVCGRPDGRLSALSTAESSVCLSVNQASSIQSLGGTCESITIGHNPFKLPLTADAVFLKRRRPLFLCERMLVENDAKEEKADLSQQARLHDQRQSSTAARRSWIRRVRAGGRAALDTSLGGSSHHDSSVRPRVLRRRSAAALIGAYMNFHDDGKGGQSTVNYLDDNEENVERVISDAIKERKWSGQARKLFHALDLDNNGFISENEFIEGAYRLKSVLPDDKLREMFRMADDDGSGRLDFEDFLNFLSISDFKSGINLPPSNRDERGIIRIEASLEKYFGEALRKCNSGKSKNEVDFMLARSQHFCQELYESRIASLQRFVAMTVMFHEMGRNVEQFFENVSVGILGYRFDRTHSIMRIATTASPVGGADVRDRMRHLRLLKKVQHSVHVIAMAYLTYKAAREKGATGPSPSQADDTVEAR